MLLERLFFAGCVVIFRLLFYFCYISGRITHRNLGRRVTYVTEQWFRLLWQPDIYFCTSAFTNVVSSFWSSFFGAQWFMTADILLSSDFVSSFENSLYYKCCVIDDMNDVIHRWNESSAKYQIFVTRLRIGVHHRLKNHYYHEQVRCLNLIRAN